MNMERFEKGPREILNPEIQKVRITPITHLFLFLTFTYIRCAILYAGL